MQASSHNHITLCKRAFFMANRIRGIGWQLTNERIIHISYNSTSGSHGAQPFRVLRRGKAHVNHITTSVGRKIGGRSHIAWVEELFQLLLCDSNTECGFYGFSALCLARELDWETEGDCRCHEVGCRGVVCQAEIEGVDARHQTGMESRDEGFRLRQRDWDND
jgi:hypothetical protein